jgi:hypothetical protein
VKKPVCLSDANLQRYGSGKHRKNHIPRVGDFNESTYYMEGNTVGLWTLNQVDP